MKIIYAFAITTSLSLNPMLTFADATDTNALIANLGAYLGFDIVTTIQKDPYSALLDSTGSTLAQQSALLTLFGAIPVNAISDELSAFVPSSVSSASSLNSMSNYTFESANYNSPSSSSGSITVNALIDQQDYQNDPINQAVLNILGTPDYSFCMNNDGSAWLTDCKYLYNLSILNNTIGTIPEPGNFFNYSYNQNIIPQLNSNTLIAPLLYTNTAKQSSGSSTDNASTSRDTTTGLTASNQMQEAANFIRYATLGVNPLTLPSFQEYNATYLTATSIDPTTTLADKTSAQNALSSYITNLRSYAAQASVPISNLYYIFSKRMPQQSGTNSTSQTSQALSEFQMATRRIYSANSQQGTQWIDQINTASPATVEKEIAILLSEINYQLYLNRQQEERQLLTSSLMLLLAAREQAPDFNSIISNINAETSTGESAPQQ